jgi:hypothetical protein
VTLANDRQRILPMPGQDGFGATRFDQGDITAYLRRDKLPAPIDVRDSLGLVSGAIASTQANLKDGCVHWTLDADAMVRRRLRLDCGGVPAAFFGDVGGKVLKAEALTASILWSE